MDLFELIFGNGCKHKYKFIANAYGGNIELYECDLCHKRKHTGCLLDVPSRIYGKVRMWERHEIEWTN